MLRRTRQLRQPGHFIDLVYTAAVLSNSDGDRRPVVEFIREQNPLRDKEPS